MREAGSAAEGAQWGAETERGAETEWCSEIARAQASAAVRERFVALAHSRPDPQLRESGPVHFTASGIVLDAPGTHVALHFHRKVGAWLQFGGHVEPGEHSFLTAARREVREESGLAGLEVVGEGPLRLHTHALNANFARCREHWDVQYLFRAPCTAGSDKAGLRLAEAESESVRWFALTALPEDLVADLREVLTDLRRGFSGS